jgi:four helix bundle protein
MRDHRRLEVFALADSLALSVYKCTKSFPNEEKYGLTSQLRRAAVSIAANIVEGAARFSDADFVRILGIAYGSACELEYELSVASRLGYLTESDCSELGDLSSRTCRALRGLIAAIRDTA